MPNPPSIVDLFCGAGGMTLGFANAGFHSIYAVDFDPWSVETYNINFQGGHGTCASIESIEAFPSADVVIGGPPCQGFSTLGKNDPRNPLNTLWRHFVRALRDIRPTVFVMENVPQLLKSREYTAFKDALPTEYLIKEAVLNAADYGVPQTRRRAIVIGSRGPSPELLFPDADHQEKGSLFCQEPWRTVGDALKAAPLRPTDDGGGHWDPFEPKAGLRLHVGRRPTLVSLKRYQAIPAGGNRFDLERLLPELTPECWKRKDRGGTDLFGRLWLDRPAVTIRTEFFKPEKGRYLHPTEDRPITIHEAALLQSFPNDYFFLGSKTSVARQIGNAVPPLLAQRLAERIAELLGFKSKITEKTVETVGVR